jgi:hypothetical protein
MTIRWTRSIPGVPGGDEVFVDLISSPRPDRLEFQWRVGRSGAPSVLKLRRTVDGQPCQVLSQSVPAGEVSDDRRVGEVADTAAVLDGVGELVRAHLDALPCDELLRLGRAVADEELSWRREEQRELKEEIPRANKAERVAHLWKVALHLESADARMAAIAMLPGWAGSPLDLGRAARAVAAPTGRGGAA